MRKYVKSNVADEVEKVVALLESNEMRLDGCHSDGVSQSVMDALKHGTAAFMDLLTL